MKRLEVIMNKDHLKDVLIGFYKFFVYTVLLSIFILCIGMINDVLFTFSRVSVLTILAYVFVLWAMMPVYGNFEIGIRKSKHVFYSSLISVFIANVISFIVIIVLTNDRINFTALLPNGFFFLLIAYVIQSAFLWTAAYLGNHLYFGLHSPSDTIILNNNHEDFSKVEAYVKSYSKQYKLIQTYDNPSISDIDFRNIKTVISLGMNSRFNSKLIKYCYYNEIDSIFNTEVHNLLSGQNITLLIGDILMTYFPKKKMTAAQAFLKRLLDIVISSILLVIVSPVFLLIGIAIKMDDGGPVFYTQERLTQNGQIFPIIKFRSMKINSGHEPVKANDDRVTVIGNKLRRFRIDEMPQFLNILKGDMSLVGPRPESIEIMERITAELPEFRFRLKVKGGLTGYAQVFGKYNTSPEKKLLLDLKYIETYSVANDIKLLFQTFIVFFKSDSTEPFE